MQLVTMWNESIAKNQPYLLTSIKNKYKYDNINLNQIIKYCIDKIAYSYCISKINDIGIICLTNNLIISEYELSPYYNEIISKSLAKAFNISVVMGIGRKLPAIYTLYKKTKLSTNNLESIIKILTPSKGTSNIITYRYNNISATPDALSRHKLFYKQVKYFGIDAIPILIVSHAMKNNLENAWIDAIKRKITTPHAVEYLKKIVRDNNIYKLAALSRSA